MEPTKCLQSQIEQRREGGRRERKRVGGVGRESFQDCRARLAEVLRPCFFPAGVDIYRSFDVATELYWVVTGEVGK